MTKQQRLIKSIVDTSKSDMPALPWARGKRRAEFIASRNVRSQKLKRA